MSPASDRSASESSSFPPPAATPEQAASLRADLADSGWGVEAVAALLGEAADAALRREIRLPALRAVRAALAAGAVPSPVAVLTALFMLGEPVPATALDAALPRTTAAGATAIGLVGEPDGAGCVRALVDLRPHEAVDDAGEVRWWVASDLGELVTGRALAPDHVLGVGGAGLTLAGLTPRTRVGTALDLGCGCGIQTLYLLRHAEHVVATDISARALAFTAFNAALAGVSVTGAPGAIDVDPGADAAPETAPGTGRLELLRGSLLEPVAGRRFDLIASNPPFVLTPPAVACPSWSTATPAAPSCRDSSPGSVSTSSPAPPPSCSATGSTVAPARGATPWPPGSPRGSTPGSLSASSRTWWSTPPCGCATAA